MQIDVGRFRSIAPSFNSSHDIQVNQENQLEISKLHTIVNKSKHVSKGITPSFESHSEEPNRNFEIASSLAMNKQV